MNSYNALNPNATIAQLYYLLIHADGRIDDKEIEMGKKLVEIEGLNSELFYNEVDRLVDADSKKLLNDCAIVLKKFERKFQIRYIAWMCVIANSDGFMDKEEWKLIYQLYHNDLKLPLDSVMAEQKEIKKKLMTIFRGVA